MATRAEEERIRQEQGERFLKQLTDMFTATRQDLAAQFVPRAEMEHVQDAVERVANAVEKLTGNVSNFHESAPRIFADRAETKQDIAELHTEIEKLKTARESDLNQGWGYRLDDMRGRYRGDARVDRGWREAAAAQSTQTLGWVIGGGFVFFTAAVSVVLSIALHH